MGPVAAGRAGGRAVGWPTPGTGPALVPAPPPARPRPRRAPAPRAALCLAERRTDIRRKAGAVEGPTSVCAAEPGVPAWDHAYLSRSLAGAPGLSALAWGRPRKISGRPLRGGGEVTRRGGGRRDQGFPSLARGTALPRAPRAFSVCQSLSLALGLSFFSTVGSEYLLGGL